MRSAELAKRNLREMGRDPLSLGLTIALPVGILLVLQALGDLDEFFSPTMLAPGIALFGFVMLMFSSAMILSKDRETALFSRLLTTPLAAKDFVVAYSLPYIAVGIIQGIVVFAVAAALGMKVQGSLALVALILLVMAIFYVALGMIFGSLLDVAPVSGAYAAVLLVTIFAGAWFELSAIGGPLQTIENLLPFTHALDATRQILDEGDGFSAVAADVYWVLAYAVAAVVGAGISFRRRMIE